VQQDEIIYLLHSINSQKLYTAIKEQARIESQEQLNRDKMNSYLNQALEALRSESR
jgi:hypothetical protein